MLPTISSFNKEFSLKQTHLSAYLPSSAWLLGRHFKTPDMSCSSIICLFLSDLSFSPCCDTLSCPLLMSYGTLLKWVVLLTCEIRNLNIILYRDQNREQCTMYICLKAVEVSFKTKFRRVDFHAYNFSEA